MKILHTADLHLDSPFEGLSSGKAAQRRLEQRMLLTKLADVANSENVDAVLLCGDLLDSENSYYETGEELIRSLRRVHAPVFIIPGNHDYYCRMSPYAKLDFSENVHIFTKNKVECFTIEEKKCKIYGGAYTEKEDPKLLDNFTLEDDGEYIRIVLAHGDIDEKTIESTNADYAALGHIHKPTGLKCAGDVYYSQPGCPEGRGFDETGDRYVNIVKVEKGRCELEKVKISSRNYEILNIDVSDTDISLAIKMALPDDTLKDIYRIVLKGETDTAIDIDLLKSSLSGYFYDVQIKDETRIKKNIWDKCTDDTLRGLFLSRLKKQYDETPDDEERKLIEQSVKWGLAALDNMEEVRCHDN